MSRPLDTTRSGHVSELCSASGGRYKLDLGVQAPQLSKRLD